MKSWPEDHPKAGLMAKKRGAILDAAHQAFLTAGYERTSMEMIAAAAGVSIMTLYRHARTKDDLFEAVVSQACEPDTGTEDAQRIEALLQRPLVEILTFIATRFRERLARPETLGLLRAVMVEQRHFPHLGQMAFDGLLTSHVLKMTEFLATRPEAAAVGAARRADISAAFFDGLVGMDQLAALLGFPIGDAERGSLVARRAAAAVMEALNGK